MKCPACKMETPEELGYCDFCKEPFRRKAPEPEPKVVEKVVVPPEVMAKVLEARNQAPAEAAGPIPPEFAALDAGERIPQLPPHVRNLAWAFLALVVFAGSLGLVYMLARAHRSASRPLPASAEGAPPPAPPQPAPGPEEPGREEPGREEPAPPLPPHLLPGSR